MFLGTYDAVINEKNRMTLPSKIVANLTQQQVVLGKGFENCIYGYELTAWGRQTEEYISNPILDKQARHVRRFIFSNSLMVPFDRQSRIVVPPFLSDYAHLEKELVLAGAGDHFEIWNKQAWEENEKTESELTFE